MRKYMADATNNFALIIAGQPTTMQSIQISPDLFGALIIRFVKTGIYYRGSIPAEKHVCIG